MRSGHRSGCGACPRPPLCAVLHSSTVYCFTLTVCCVWHFSLQGETLEKPLPADSSFKLGDAVGIAHMYRPRRGSRNPYWPGRVILCYPKGHASGYDYKVSYDDFDDDKHASVWVGQMCSFDEFTTREEKNHKKIKKGAANGSSAAANGSSAAAVAARVAARGQEVATPTKFEDLTKYGDVTDIDARIAAKTQELEHGKEKLDKFELPSVHLLVALFMNVLNLVALLCSGTCKELGLSTRRFEAT